MRGSFARGALVLLLTAALMLCSCLNWATGPTGPEEIRSGDIAGRVYSAGTTQPVSLVSVCCLGVSATTGADGAYVLSNVTSGSRTMWAFADGYMTYQCRVEVPAYGTTTHNIELTPAP
jgi:hypothetical protein